MKKNGLLIDPQSSHRSSGRKRSKRNPKKYIEKSETNITPTLQQPDVVTPMTPQMSTAALQIPSQMLPQYTLLQGFPRILAPQLSAHLPFQTPMAYTASSNTLASNFSSYTHAGAPTGSANWTSIAATSTISLVEWWYVI